MSKHSNNKKTRQLGMPIGTASARLRKAVMFNLVVKLGENNCYRCGKPIVNAEDLSLDHKKDWLDVDPKLFWDVENIAFSHLKCNSPARRYGGKALRKVCQEGYAWCSYCSACKPVTDFSRNKKKWDGIHNNCKECDKKRKDNWRYGGEA